MKKKLDYYRFDKTIKTKHSKNMQAKLIKSNLEENNIKLEALISKVSEIRHFLNGENRGGEGETEEKEPTRVSKGFLKDVEFLTTSNFFKIVELNEEIDIIYKSLFNPVEKDVSLKQN
jgi:hypothetical protein